MPMIYRSPFTRWFLSVVGFVAGSLLAFGDGDQWRSTPSLQWLDRLPIPLQAWGVAFLVYAVMLMFVRSRPEGFAVGAFLFSVFAVSLLATIGDGGPKNAVAIAALLDVVVLHAYSIRTAEAIKQTTPRRGAT